MRTLSQILIWKDSESRGLRKTFLSRLSAFDLLCFSQIEKNCEKKTFSKRKDIHDFVSKTNCCDSEEFPHEMLFQMILCDYICLLVMFLSNIKRTLKSKGSGLILQLQCSTQHREEKKTRINFTIPKVLYDGIPSQWVVNVYFLVPVKWGGCCVNRDQILQSGSSSDRSGTSWINMIFL